MNHLSRVLICLLLLIGTSYAHATEQIKEWNFLVYLNGVNSLDSFGADNLNQMEEVGSSNKMNIIVEWGSLANPNVSRLLIKKDNNTKKVTSPIVQNLGGADMGDWKELVRFVDWSNQNYPAKHYFIVVWDHGSGWHVARANSSGPNNHIQDISWDDRTGHNFSTEQLAQAMTEASKIIGHKVDVYASDACLMGMAEVASQMQDSVQYYAGSQDVEPGPGWPYSSFLSQWSAKIDSLSAKDVAVLLSKSYGKAYNGGIYGTEPVTMSAYDMSYMSAYEQAVKAVGQDLSNLNTADLAKASQAADKTKYFTLEDYKDSLDFLNQLEAAGVKKSSFANLRAAQKNFVLSNDQNQDQFTWGVSIWLPTDLQDYKTYVQRYEGLTFAQNSNWGAFLKRLSQK